MTKMLFQGLFVSTLLALVSCTHVTVKNTEACVVAGKLGAGADCANTLSPTTREMDFNEFVDWLEPDAKTGRGPAVCQSANDWNAMKTALEQTCAAVKDLCTYEMKQQLTHAAAAVESLLKKSKAKASTIKQKD